MQDPISYTRHRTRLPDNELEWMVAAARTRRLKPGDAFLGIGVEHHELGFLTEGILQCYGVAYSGEKVVLDLSFPGTFVAALDTAVRGLASEVCFEAITPATLMVWPFDIHLTASTRNSEWQTLQTAIVTEAYIRKHCRYLALRTKSAEARYLGLDADFPPEWRGVPLHIVASYLNITPQYLSSLRRKDSSGKLLAV